MNEKEKMIEVIRGYIKASGDAAAQGNSNLAQKLYDKAKEVEAEMIEKYGEGK